MALGNQGEAEAFHRTGAARRSSKVDYAWPQERGAHDTDAGERRPMASCVLGERQEVLDDTRGTGRREGRSRQGRCHAGAAAQTDKCGQHDVHRRHFGDCRRIVARRAVHEAGAV